MKIAIDISPLETGHKVRGTGFYLKHLRDALLKYFNNHDYTFFSSKNHTPTNIDLIHYPYFDPFQLTLPLRKKSKTVVTVHDLTPLVFPNNFPVGFKGNIKWILQKSALKQVDAIITDSMASKNDICKYTGISADKIRVVYLAAGEEFKKSEDKNLKQNIIQKYNLPEKFILYVGDVTWNKNLPRLLTAVKQLDLPLIIVGKAIKEDSFDMQNVWNSDLVKVKDIMKNNDKFIPLGFIPQEDIVALYQTAVVFVMPSIYEGFGLPVLEAMQSGCPVLTTKEGSLKEVAGDAALFVDPFNINNIAEGIKNIYHSKSLQKELSEKGLINAERFSWKKTAKETIKVYEDLVK